jgi:hypothetical protein
MAAQDPSEALKLNALRNQSVNDDDAGDGLAVDPVTGKMIVEPADATIVVDSSGVKLGLVKNIDGGMWLPSIGGVSTGGVWTVVSGSGSNLAMRRSAGAGDGFWSRTFELPGRGTADRGRKILSVDAVYSVTTGPVDDVRIRLRKQVVPADGVGMASIITLPGNYDTGHDTALKRGADDGGGGIRYHTSKLTLTGPEYIADGVGYDVVLFVDADGAGVGVVDLYGWYLRWEEALVS